MISAAVISSVSFLRLPYSFTVMQVGPFNVPECFVAISKAINYQEMSELFNSSIDKNTISVRQFLVNSKLNTEGREAEADRDHKTAEQEAINTAVDWHFINF